MCKIKENKKDIVEKWNIDGIRNILIRNKKQSNTWVLIISRKENPLVPWIHFFIFNRLANRNNSFLATRGRTCWLMIKQPRVALFFIFCHHISLFNFCSTLRINPIYFIIPLGTSTFKMFMIPHIRFPGKFNTFK